MSSHQSFTITRLALAVALAMPLHAWAEEPLALDDDYVLATAREELKQAPGVSIITAEDLRKSPPANDLAEIIRRQPGVNLTGNSSSGARGNNRQIDIRGMGPENTLILIDGKPIASRNAVRYGWRGDRDTRGDTNWVPADQVERIEVLRGPAAARYGSGAAGGVINIVTRQAGVEQHGSLTLYQNFPSHAEEGATRRATFGLNGPLGESLSYRIYGNVARTDADDEDINRGHEIGNYTTAGREGVRNRDVNGVLAWRMAPEQVLELEAGFGRQGNIYAGDSMNNVASASLEAYRAPWIGRETNTLYRQNYAMTHRGEWDFGSTLNYLQYEQTRNARLREGLAGGPEGNINSDQFGTIHLDTLTAHSEASLPLSFGVEQMLTFGAEFSEQKLEDGVSDLTAASNIANPAGGLDSKMAMRILSFFVEDNIELRPGTILTPGLRFDHNDQTGDNWSPALNLSQMLSDTLTLKAGIARAYKAPNLYQLNPGYALYSAGNGCWAYSGTGCFLLGNENLEAETSVNKELGIEYRQGGWSASATWFRNDYRNKIEAGRTPVGTYFTRGAEQDVYLWENVPRAVVEGIEGSLGVPLADDLRWTTNLTWMLDSENKETGEPLSIIPEFTLNSTLDWQASDPLSLQARVTWYGRQTPGKYGYQGVALSGDARREIPPYALVGLSGTYELSRNLSLSAGIDNLFDKRLYREGNAVVAGAYTYNEPGRTFFTSISTTF